MLAICVAAPMLGCGGGGGQVGSASGDTAATRTTGAQPATVATQPTIPRRREVALPVKVHASRYGKILVDRRGRTLYLFTADSAHASHCNGECAHVWPPYHSQNAAIAQEQGRGLARLVGQIHRADGSRQVTVRGHPLYYYIGDRRPGQILCQDVEEYGGHWWLVSPAGRPVTGSAPPC